MADTTTKEATNSKEQVQPQQQAAGATPTTNTTSTPAAETPSGSATKATTTATKSGSTQSAAPTGSAAPEAPRITMQKYNEAKAELQELLSRKKKVDANLINLESSIYSFEGSYLEDTQQNGNIIRGFDGYLSNRPERRKQKFTELDRLFSLSSSTYQTALAQKERDESSQDDRSTSSALSARRDRNRKLKSMSSNDIRRKRWHGSAGRDSDEDGDT